MTLTTLLFISTPCHSVIGALSLVFTGRRRGGRAELLHAEVSGDGPSPRHSLGPSTLVIAAAAATTTTTNTIGGGIVSTTAAAVL